MANERIPVGAEVEWTSQGGSYSKTKWGRVLAYLPRGAEVPLPADIPPSRRHFQWRCLIARYLVEVPRASGHGYDYCTPTASVLEAAQRRKEVATVVSDDELVMLWNSQPTATMAEIGRRIGVTRERVRQRLGTAARRGYAVRPPGRVGRPRVERKPAPPRPVCVECGKVLNRNANLNSAGNTYCLRHRHRNPDKRAALRASRQRWVERNPEKMRAYNQKCYQRRKAAREVTTVADMLAGPELNALIAREVMGWSEPIEVRARGSQVWKMAFRRRLDGDLGDYGCYYTRDGTKVYCGKPFSLHWPEHYSTTWEGMGRVVERMRELEYPLRLQTREGMDGNPVWWAQFSADGGCKADTAPHAVCLAALRAVGA